MKQLFFKATVAACSVLGFATAAQAATSYSNSYKYFDEAGNVVGQQIVYCDNHAYYGGNVHTAYNIRETKECDPRTPPPRIIVSGTQISGYVLPGSLSISAACLRAQCIGSGEYPDKMVGVSWTWISGNP